jgi:hypothetical protein
MPDEMRFHIEEYVADLVREGTPREEAERRSRVGFGAMEVSERSAGRPEAFSYLTRSARMCGAA